MNKDLDVDKIELYYIMKKINMVEKSIHIRFQEQEMRTPVHLAIGQEAIAAGVMYNLKRSDVVFSNHRGHGHYIAKGGSVYKLIAELYNKETGCSKGRGGSMHIMDLDVGFQLTSSIVGGTVPLATGYALKFKMIKNDEVVVVFLGDGASEEGCVYESICFAALHRLPIVYICENNLYAMHTALEKREPVDGIYKKFSNYICSFKGNGNDVYEVNELASGAINRARAGEGPTFIEFETYRLVNHYETKGGNDLGFRDKEEFDNKLKELPIQIYENYLLDNKILGVKRKEEIEKEIQDEIDDAYNLAKMDNLPKSETILEGLW